jgi:hypothetical protein
MADWQCAQCRAQVAPGAPRCPECPSTEFIKAEAEAVDVLKISRDGAVSDSAAVQENPAASAVDASLAELAEPGDAEARLTAEDAAGASSPDAPEPEPALSPAAPPRTPPRRSPPPAVPA